MNSTVGFYNTTQVLQTAPHQQMTQLSGQQTGLNKQPSFHAVTNSSSDSSSPTLSNGNMSNILGIRRSPLSSKTETHQSSSSGFTSRNRDNIHYLKQLLQDKKSMTSLSSVFTHSERLLDEEIVRVRAALFQNVEKKPLELPAPEGPQVTLMEKVFVDPQKKHQEYNFVGRILGPRGLTAKQLEQETKCKIMVRGKGSMRDRKKEEMHRGKPNWEHLSEELHVLITVEDTQNRAKVKMQRAVEEVNKLLIPTEGDDELKKKQLMELAIINGTYRDFSAPSNMQPRLLQGPPQILQNVGQLRPAAGVPGQQQIGVLNGHGILSRLPNGQALITNGLHPAQHQPMLTSDGSVIYYTPTNLETFNPQSTPATLAAAQSLGTNPFESYPLVDQTLLGKNLHHV